ncbi:hypothetical protein A2949_00265 [Candidatus Adlerbacteria bacterium RIFCSPLOWO2_01_FULL_54_21b]|nr:MAG: hypothetical protein A2949_00265 [Candidatus Adlerbacteria bacterium RIFCSPLOWO2_01_FULL_54_21b]
MLRQDKFNSSTLLRSLAYSVALSVRQAQVYSTSVRETSLGSGIFSSGFGVYFPGALAQYYVFADANSNGARNVGEDLPGYKIGSDFTVKDFCASVVGTGALHCLSSASGPTHIDTLTIFFRRPNPDACVVTSTAGSCALGVAAVYSDAYIQLASTHNSDARSIKVSSSGQISVCAPNTTAPAC